MRNVFTLEKTMNDGTFDTWNMDPVEPELKQNSKPNQAKPITVPYIQKKALYNRLLNIGAL